MNLLVTFTYTKEDGIEEAILKDKARKSFTLLYPEGYDFEDYINATETQMHSMHLSHPKHFNDVDKYYDKKQVKIIVLYNKAYRDLRGFGKSEKYDLFT